MKIIINNNEYEYNEDIFIREICKNYIKDDILNIDEISDNDKYYCVEKIFNYMCHMITGLSGDPFPTKELEEENAKIRERMNKVDNIQKFLKEHDKENESIDTMNKFMEVMLKHNEEYLKHGDEFVEEDEYGII